MMTHGVAVQFISAAAGYWVLTQASKERGRIKQLGQFLGLLIVVVSLVGVGCKLYYLMNSQGFPGGMSCPFFKKTP